MCVNEVRRRWSALDTALTADKVWSQKKVELFFTLYLFI